MDYADVDFMSCPVYIEISRVWEPGQSPTQLGPLWGPVSTLLVSMQGTHTGQWISSSIIFVQDKETY
jgi:hypothetical protein